MATALSLAEAPAPAPDDDGAELSLRDEIEAAFEQEPTDEVKPEGSAAPAAPAEAPAEPSEGRQRDEFGRFLGKTPREAAAPAASAPAAPAAPAPAELKPPASWTPQAREEWAGLPPRVKQEIHRREWEATRVVQDGAQARQFVQAFENVVRPYEVFIRGENSTPLQAVQNMMQTAADLRMGTATHKAQLVAGLVKTFGVDVQMLDDALDVLINGAAAGAGREGGARGQQFRDPRVDELLAQRQREEQQRSMQASQQAAHEQEQMRGFLAMFAEKHEFYGDVAADMADMIDMASRRGEYVDLEKIYARACKLNEEVSTILAQRAAAAQRQQSTSNAVLRAKRAASSVKGEPTPDGATVPKDDSIRAAIEAAFEGSRV